MHYDSKALPESYWTLFLSRLLGRLFYVHKSQLSAPLPTKNNNLFREAEV